jgi:ring-1,2-phenylacetyl-CoA epoxidase subunit PaaD
MPPAGREASAGRDGAAEQHIWRLLEEINDPEIPVVSLVDLGIVRYVTVSEGQARVGLAPTYSGCPATEVIEAMVSARLGAAGYAAARIERVLSPPWTTDWISARGRQRLLAYGIAPPEQPSSSRKSLTVAGPTVACPRCGDVATERVSEFGSTPCKAAYKCTACLEPFEYFKCI